MIKYRIDVNSESIIIVDNGLGPSVISELTKRAINACLPSPTRGNSTLRTVLFTRLDDAPPTENIINQGVTFDTMNVKIPETISDKKLVAIIKGALTGEA